MRKKINKLFLMFLLTAMAVTPLQGAHASVDLVVAGCSGQIQHLSGPSHLSSTTVDQRVQACEQCHQKNCCDGQLCHSGTCSSSPAVIISLSSVRVVSSNQTITVEYPRGGVITRPYALFRPPRA